MIIERIQSNWYDHVLMKPAMKILGAPVVVFTLAVVVQAAGISVSPDVWDIGPMGSGQQYTQSFTVQNTGFEMLNVRVKGTNSLSWTLGASAAYNQFRLEFDAAGDSSYQNLTTSYQDESSGTNNMINKRYNQTFTLYLRMTAPTSASSAQVQDIFVDIQGTTDDFWTYNSAGAFYWSDVGGSGAPLADWATSSSTIMASSKWQYMTNPSSGWKTFSAAAVTNSFTTLQTFVIDNIRTGGNGNAIAGTCFYTHNSLRTYNFTSVADNAARSRRVSFVKYSIGTLINSALATNTYATRSVLVPSLLVGSADAINRSYSLTFCSQCGYVPSMVTNNGGVAATCPDRTIVSSHFSIGTPPARIIVLN